ncbi:uncharacterized protein VSU04_001813 [Chlamydotis macqueenii]
MSWKMEMDVKGVSPCPEPIPPAAGSGACPHQRPHHRDGQPAEPAPAADSSHPERRHGGEKEDKKASALKHSGFHWAWCLVMSMKSAAEANSRAGGRPTIVDPLHI